jgi:hypothetical protein
MSGDGVWLTVLLLGIGSAALKGAGPVLLGGRTLPPRVMGMVRVLAPAMLAALVATQAAVDGRELVADARLAGLAVAFVALLLRAPTLLVVGLAALATALARGGGCGS